MVDSGEIVEPGIQTKHQGEAFSDLFAYNGINYQQ